MVLGMVPNRIRSWLRGGRWSPSPSLAAGCGSDGASGAAARRAATTGAGKVRVVTTTPVLTDFARNVGGDDVDVYSVLKPNVDPHDYEPSPADLEADRPSRRGRQERRRAGEVVRGHDRQRRAEGRHRRRQHRRHRSATRTATRRDPHIWHDPRNAKIMVANIAARPRGGRPRPTPAGFEQHAAAYTAELDALDADVAAQLATLTNKKLVTNHDAFGYYVDRYGLDFVGAVIPSFDTQAELSQQDINDLVAAIKAAGREGHLLRVVPAAEDGRGHRQARPGVKVVEGDDALYGDTLGPAGSDGATYLDMVEHNTK